MTENLSFCSQEMLQPRMEWNMVLRLTNSISAEAKKAEIDPHQIVFVGGIATFLHTKQVLGNRAVNFWRGTHDVDLVITERGGTGKILAGLQNSDYCQYIDSSPSHFVNKQAWSFQNRPHGFLSEKNRNTDIDVYFMDKDSNGVIFNDRFISPYPANFISEPVKLVNVPYKGKEYEIAIPSIADCITMKFDIVKLSGKLREKDKTDILSLLMVAERQAMNESDLLEKVFGNVNGKGETRKIGNEMEEVFTGLIQCYKHGNIPVDRRVFIPSEDYVRKCRDRLTSGRLGKLK